MSLSNCAPTPIRFRASSSHSIMPKDRTKHAESVADPDISMVDAEDSPKVCLLRTFGNYLA